MRMTNFEKMAGLLERMMHCDTMRSLSPHENELLRDMTAYAESMNETEREYWYELPFDEEEL